MRAVGQRETGCDTCDIDLAVNAAMMETMRRGAGFLLCLCSCGRVGFDGGGSAGADAGDPASNGDGGAGTLVTDASPPCTFGAWGTATNLTSLNTTANDWSPTLSDDGLEVIWETTRTGNQDLFRAVRATSTDPFGPAAALAVLNSAQSEASPSLSRDRLTLYFSSNRSGSWRLYRATRADKDDAFAAPVLVPELATVNVLGPALTAAGDELFFTNLSESSISRAVMTNGTFSVAGVMSELGTSASAYPDVSRDGLTIYFDTNSSQLVSATRSAPGGTFSTPATMSGSLDSGSGEADAELGDGDRQLAFSSNRPGGAGSWDIWLATRPCD